MGSKVNSKAWVGNICLGFESVCNEVDSFISKGTVKFVENQANVVGLGVKRFYSRMVQDILPLKEGNAKLEKQAMTGKLADVEKVSNSMKGIKGKPVSLDEKQLCVDQDSIDTLGKNDKLMPSELEHAGQCTSSPAADHCDDQKTDLPFEKDGDCIISNNSDNGVNENITRDSMPMIANSGSEDRVLTMTCSYANNGDCNSTTLSMDSLPTPPVCKAAELLAFPKEGILHSRFLDDIECYSDISASGWESELELPEAEDSNCDEHRSSSVRPVVSVDKGQEDNVLLIESSTSSVDDVDHRKTEKDGPLSNNISMQDEYFNASSAVHKPELGVLFFSCDNEEEDNDILSSSCSVLPESSNISDLTFSRSTQKAEDAIDPHVDSTDCIYDKSDNHTCSLSSTTAAYKAKTSDFVPRFISSVSTLEKDDVNTSMILDSVSLVGSAGSRQVNYYDDPQRNLVTCPSEIGNFHKLGCGIFDPNKVTVDFSDKTEYDGICATVSCSNVYGASCRGRNFRYYEKLIKDAFLYHKRLTKEYEHLAILYGDIDKELWHHQHIESSYSLAAASPLQRSTPQTEESDWELL